MKKIIILSIFNFTLAQPAFSYEYEADISAPCEKSSDCVLFEDECQMLSAFLKNKLPEGSEIRKQKKISYFAWKKELLPTCEKKFFAKPTWPKNPRTECIKKQCTLL